MCCIVTQRINHYGICVSTIRVKKKTRQAIYVQLNTEAHAYNHCCCGKAISITYSEAVCVALVIQHTKRMFCIIQRPVACPALPYLSTLSHKRRNIKKKVIEHKICVLNLSTTFVSNIFQSKKTVARYYHKCRRVFI